MVVGLAVAALLVQVASGPLHDVDLYWHLLAGGELLQGVPADSIGINWTFAPASSVLPWTSTQSLSEVLLHALHAWVSWPGLAAYRVLTAALAIAVLAQTSLRGRRSVSVAAFPFLIAALTVALLSQERPQQFTFIGAAALGGVLANGLAGRLPSAWILVPATILWSNLHGGWILVPGALLLIALARLVDHGAGDVLLRRALALLAATLAAGALTPAGVAGLTAPFRFVHSTEHLIEWQPVQPITVPGSVTVLMLLILLAGWYRRAAPKSEYVVCVALLLFSWTAWRNMTPALLMLAPLAASRLEASFPDTTRSKEPSWSAASGVILASAGLAIALATLPHREHLPYDTWPIALAEQLNGRASSARVLTDYNTSGIVLYFGGSGTATSIDGRADRYRPDYVEAHRDLMDLRGEWDNLLLQLAPTAALIEQDSALALHLERQLGWDVVGQDGDYVLMEASRS